MSLQIPEQELWLGRMQNELGVLTSNLMLLEIQRDKLAAKVIADAELIEALKNRIKIAEEANTELKAVIQPERRKIKNAKDTV
jgi:hypothetical protein